MTRPTLAEIRRAAAVIHGMTEDDIRSRARLRQYVDARQDAWIVSRRHKYSLKQIGGAWGVNHTSVMNCISERCPHDRSDEMTALIDVLARILSARRLEMVERFKARPDMPQDEVAQMIRDTSAAQEEAVKIMGHGR